MFTFLQLVDNMTLNMINIHHWKVYDDQYGDHSALGRLILQAQVILIDAFDSLRLRETVK